MINEESIQACEKSFFSKNFIRPLYDSYSFSKIPGTIISLLSGNVQEDSLNGCVVQKGKKGFDTVVLFLIDAFGWSFFEKYLPRVPFLHHFIQDGIVSRITTLFPSTTAPHITCLHTGLDGGQSGLYEWFIYEPKLNRIITPLPFYYAGNHQKAGALEADGLEPEDLYPQNTIYEKFRSQDIESTIFQPSSIADSTYSKSLQKGATIIHYESFSEALQKLIALLKTPANKKRYCLVYFGDIDSVGHRKGINSNEFESVVSTCFLQLEEHFFSHFQEFKQNLAFIVTADHGMVEVDPKKTFYLNREIPRISDYLLKGADGKPLAPAGSCRDFFLHVHENKLSEMKEILTKRLQGKAEVYFTKELIRKKLFSPFPVSDNFLKRVGNLVLLPLPDEGIWWYEKNRFEQKFYGVHGGLTKEEATIPFLFFSN
ncbi:MAG: alkaline phosphatase family protein [Chlamydiae bacterium]|nr:alkaline phosphatase family protein [Chlamydiota bacterium]